MHLPDPVVFFSESRRILSERATQWQLSLRHQDLIVPKGPNQYLVFSKTKRWNDFLFCAIVHFYLTDQFTKYSIRLSLEERVTNFGTDKAIVAHTILSSEPEMLLYFSESNVYKNTREWFGFIKQQIDWNRFRLHRIVPKRPRYQERQRGYKDQGAKRPDHRWNPSHDISLTELQNEIERVRQRTQDTISFVKGGLP